MVMSGVLNGAAMPREDALGRNVRAKDGAAMPPTPMTLAMPSATVRAMDGKPLKKPGEAEACVLVASARSVDSQRCGANGFQRLLATLLAAGPLGVGGCSRDLMDLRSASVFRSVGRGIDVSRAAQLLRRNTQRV